MRLCLKGQCNVRVQNLYIPTVYTVPTVYEASPEGITIFMAGEKYALTRGRSFSVPLNMQLPPFGYSRIYRPFVFFAIDVNNFLLV
jgi:hypothetical protein